MVYYDWFNNATNSQWKVYLANYYKDVGFDGLWTTENEPFASVPGELKLNANGEEEHVSRVLKEEPF